MKKADITKEWYRYGNQQWANAVITGNSYDLLGSNVHGATKQEDSVHLDGENDYIDLGLTNYQFTNGITLAITVKFNENKTYNQEFFGNWQGGGGGLAFSKSGKVYVSFHINGEYTPSLLADEAPKLNEYYTIIVTYNNSTIKMYVNGSKQNQEETISGTITQSAMPIFIGANPDTNTIGNPANIDVKQAAVFNRAISEAEIQDISNNNFKITDGEGLLKYVDFTNKTYEDGEVISEDNIESYFVWIPRYEYQLWNGQAETNEFTSIKENLGVIEDATKEAKLNQQQPIRIEFESKKVPVSQSTEKGEYLTHPAFTSFDSNGFWVGKFETGYKGATDTSTAQVNEKDVSKIIVKPNVYSWRNINLVNSFDNSKDYKQNLDSHMMKNMEWGAVAYLTNSKYGRCKNNKCEKVRINNSNSYVTGSSASKTPTIGYDAYSDYESNKPGEDTINVKNYNNSASVASSTTNNYSGIYDMVGGAWERVMGVMNDSNGSSFINQAGFTSVPEEKYYDVYGYSATNQNFNRGLFGDGTKEFGPFYKGTYNIQERQLGSWCAGDAVFVNLENPWFERGGSPMDGADADISAFYMAGTVTHNLIGFRIVLTP